MKRLLFFFLVLSFELSWGIDSTSVKVVYCGVDMLVPPECEYQESKIKCDKEFIQWIDYSDLPEQVRQMTVQQLFDQTLAHLEKKDPEYQKKQMKFKSLGFELDGWLISMKINQEEKYFIYAWGKVNSKLLSVYCGIAEKPDKRHHLPDFINQIIQIKN